MSPGNAPKSPGFYLSSEPDCGFGDFVQGCATGSASRSVFLSV
jgi:hypothetical protein